MHVIFVCATLTKQPVALYNEPARPDSAAFWYVAVTRLLLVGPKSVPVRVIGSPPSVESSESVALEVIKVITGCLYPSVAVDAALVTRSAIVAFHLRLPPMPAEAVHSICVLFVMLHAVAVKVSALDVSPYETVTFSVVRWKFSPLRLTVTPPAVVMPS